MKSVVLIPARMESTRFPGKPLALIAGRPMIEWVFEAAEDSEASDVFVVTDSQEIMDTVTAFGGAAIMTTSAPLNGTERCQEALEIMDPNGDTYDVIVNIQGDEPLIQSDDINQLLSLFDSDDVDIATLITPIENEKEYRDPNVVKAVPTLFEDEFCDICYFSRSPVPYTASFNKGIAFKHIGVYGFTATAFDEIKNMEPTPLESAERLEQLRWLQNHLVISAFVCPTELHGVDTPEDLLTVENILKSK